MNRQERIDYLTKKHSGWKVGDIKSPWLRLPVAWLIVGVVLPALLVPMTILAVVIGGSRGAFDEVASVWSRIPLAASWRAVTDVSRKP